MGQADEQRLAERDARNGRRSNRGSTNNRARLSVFATQHSHGTADWGGCSSARIQGVIVGIGALGGAVTFGYSRDGGAHFLTLLLDADKSTLWFNGDADLDLELDQVLAKLQLLWDEASG